MRRRRLLRRAPYVVAALVLLLGVAYFALRDSSTFQVRDVTVRGVSGPDAPKVEATLRETARDMTTLDVDGGRLRQSVADYPTVKDLEVDRDLPHGLTITIHEKRPVAIVDHGGKPVPLAADGRLLTGATPPDDVPRLGIGDVTGTRIDDLKGRQLVAVVAAAPTALRHRTDRAEFTDKGLTLEMVRGPELYFGTPDDLQAKWNAAARVLADPTIEGATYVDVRVPERPAAGGLAPLVEDDQSGQAPANPIASTSTGA
jgi:cell division protein FtsQ